MNLVRQASYWEYAAPPTPDVGPPGFTGDWHSLSPGMRREIWRRQGQALAAPVGTSDDTLQEEKGARA